MYIAMNRFRIALGREKEFEEIWKNRESFLHEAKGFKEFHLLRGASNESFTLYASHSVWESPESFEDWTKSESFRKAHANARPPEGMHLGPPQFEGFQTIGDGVTL